MGLNEQLTRFGRPLLMIPPILVGAAVLAAVMAGRNKPQPAEIPEAARPLVVIPAPRTDVVPRVLGYGTARPGDIWSAVADVAGRIEKIHPRLKAGTIVNRGEMVVQIDPTQYELRVAELEAELAQIVAQQAELEAQRSNFEAALEIERQALALAERELERSRRLLPSGAITESEYDEVERDVLAQRQSVQSMRNSLNVLPAQQQALAANLEATRAGLGQAQLDRDHATIRAPFKCRLSEVSLEVGQFITAGQAMFDAYGADLTEIEAQLPIDRVRTLLQGESEIDLSANDPNVVRSVLDVDAVVRLRTGALTVEWPAEFDRVREELDLQTRTLRVVVAVPKPYENVIPGRRPPLAPGMFCEVELRGRPRPGRVVVPRTAVRDDAVYLVNSESRLERRPVIVAFSQGGFSVIGEGLEGGERLVVSDPTPAVVGMLVTPINDAEVTTHLLAEATGAIPVR